MKFHMLPVGARFEVRGKIYVKSGPLTANDARGGQQLLPRATMVNPIEGASQPGQPPSAPALTPQAVRAAFDGFEADYRHRLLQLGSALGEPQAQRLIAEIDAAGRAFLTRLGLTGEGG